MSMQLIDIKKVEDCFDGSMIFRYSFNKEMDEELMRKMGEKENAKLHYYPDFPRPFFKIITGEGIQVKGILGDDNLEAVFPQTGKWEKKKKFEAHLERILKNKST